MSSLFGAMKRTFYPIDEVDREDGLATLNRYFQKYITVEPSELRFTAELGTELTCPLQLSNETYSNIAFKVTATDPNKYSVRPNNGHVLPLSTCDIIVTMQAQREFPEDMQCMDEIHIQLISTISRVIDPNMFNAGQSFYKRKLRIVYVTPLQSPSPIVEGSEESFSPSTPVSDDGNSNTSDLKSIPKENEEPGKQYSEVTLQAMYILCRADLSKATQANALGHKFWGALYPYMRCTNESCC